MTISSLSHLAPPAREPLAQHLGGNNAFIAGCIEFDEIIAKLQAARALHFGHDLDGQRTWTDASTLRAANTTLANALNFLIGAEV